MQTTEANPKCYHRHHTNTSAGLRIELFTVDDITSNVGIVTANRQRKNVSRWLHIHLTSPAYGFRVRCSQITLRAGKVAKGRLP